MPTDSARHLGKEKLGWVGLGRMGAPMAANLAAAGWPLVVYNRSREKALSLLSAGAELVETPAEIGQKCNIVFSMVQDDFALRSIAIGPEGVMHAMQPGGCFIDMSTVSPSVSAEVARLAKDRSIAFLRAPVSGSVANAAAGILTIFASGPADAFERCRPLLETVGRNLFYVGEAEQARFLKLAINVMAGATASLIAEALVLGEKGGVDWETMIDIMKVSAIGSPIINYKADALKRRDFTPTFTATQMAKDFDFALDVARQVQAPMQITALVRQHFTAMQSSGRGEWDLFGYVDLLEEVSGLKSTAKI